MSTCPICSNQREPFKFAINCIPDEKLAFVERVCGLLVQSRYGMDRVYEHLARPHHMIDDDFPDTFFVDAPRFTLPRIGILHRLTEKIKTTASLFSNAFKKSGTQTRSPSSLGRGSPTVSSRSRNFANS